MDAEIKRLASLKNKDKSDSLSDKKTPQEAKANSKENATANVVQQTRPSSSSNTQRKTGKPSDSRNPSVDSASETSSATDAETPKAKRGRKKKSDAQTANAPENSAAAPNVKQAGKQKVSSEAKPAPAAKPKANTAASTQPNQTQLLLTKILRRLNMVVSQKLFSRLILRYPTMPRSLRKFLLSRLPRLTRLQRQLSPLLSQKIQSNRQKKQLKLRLKPKQKPSRYLKLLQRRLPQESLRLKLFKPL